MACGERADLEFAAHLGCETSDTRRDSSPGGLALSGKRLERERTAVEKPPHTIHKDVTRNAVPSYLQPKREQLPELFLSVTMGAFNEEAAIERVILEHVRVLQKLQPQVSKWEIVCVDDGSTDTTPQILERLQSRLPELRVIRHQVNQGIAATQARLYREGWGTHIYFTGSDGQWPPENLPRMLGLVLAGADLVVGVRENRNEVYNLRRQFVSFAFNLLPQILLGGKTGDAGSVKLGRRELFTMPLVSRSPFAEAERIVQAHRSGYKVDFIPIRFCNRSGGKAKGASWKNVASSTGDLFRCFLHYRLGLQAQVFCRRFKGGSCR
jgi:glycosyltransferase involved in cell wall biosynthesis